MREKKILYKTSKKMKNNKYKKSILKITLIIVGAIILSYLIFTWNRVISL